MSEQYITSSPTQYQYFERLMRDLTKLPNNLPLSVKSYKQHFNTSTGHIPVIIALAIWSSPEKRLTLAQIRAAIEPYFPEAAGKDFRGTLSNKHMFVRLHRGAEHGGRGSFWGVDPSQQGSKKSGQSSSPPGSPTLDETLYEWALSTGVTPSMLHASLPSSGGEPNVQRPGTHRRPTPHAPY